MWDQNEGGCQQEIGKKNSHRSSKEIEGDGKRRKGSIETKKSAPKPKTKKQKREKLVVSWAFLVGESCFYQNGQI